MSAVQGSGLEGYHADHLPHFLKLTPVLFSPLQAQKASDGYVNDAAYFYELILAFSDLFERRDKLIVQKMQRLQSKQSSGVSWPLPCIFIISIPIQVLWADNQC